MKSTKFSGLDHRHTKFRQGMYFFLFHEDQYLLSFELNELTAQLSKSGMLKGPGLKFLVLHISVIILFDSLVIRHNS